MNSQCRLMWASTPRRVDDRGDGEHDGGGDQALGAAGDHLGDRHQPDRAGRLHPVLDLPGEAELLRHGRATAWMPWNMIEMPDDAGHQHGGEGRLGRRAAAAADALADLREDVEEDEAQQERLDERAQDELDRCFRSTTRSRSIRAPQRGPAGGGRRAGRAGRRCGAGVGGLGGQRWSAISRAGPFRSGR